MNSIELENSWNLHLNSWANLCPAMHKPSLQSNEQYEVEFAELIIKARKFLKEKNLARYANLLVLDHFVNYVFTNMDPDYRMAKWYEMLEYMKVKYGSVKIPKKIPDDQRESSFYNSIALLRSGYRGKRQGIRFDKSILELPFAREWICIERRSKQDRIHIKKPKLSDSDYWLIMLMYLLKKYGRYQLPNSKSDDVKERKYANRMNNWKQIIKGNSKGRYPDVELFELPKAKEWLSVD